MKKIALLSVLFIIAIGCGCTNLQAQGIMKPKSKSHLKSKTHHLDTHKKVKKSPKRYGNNQKRTPYAAKDTVNTSIVNTITSAQKSSAFKYSKQFGGVYDKNNPIHKHKKIFRNNNMLLNNKDVINPEDDVTYQEYASDSTINSLDTLYIKMLKDADIVGVLLQNAPWADDALRKIKKLSQSNLTIKKALIDIDANSYRISTNKTTPSM